MPSRLPCTLRLATIGLGHSAILPCEGACAMMQTMLSFEVCTPQQLAKTLRVQRAKRLLDSGDHTMTDIAFQAGFGSLRRLNAAFAELYGRSPSSLRAVRQ